MSNSQLIIKDIENIMSEMNRDYKSDFTIYPISHNPQLTNLHHPANL